MSENCSGVDPVNGGVSALPVNEKGRNKRKFLSDPQFKTPVEFSSMSLTEFPRYEMIEENFQNALNELGSIVERSEETEEQDVECQECDWDDPVTCQLEELLTDNLLATFNGAVRKIVESGYTEEDAERAVLNSSLFHGSKDAVSNIVDGAIAVLKREIEFNTPALSVFEGLEDLVDYMLLEMIYVLQEVRPSLTVSEAMWCLLINDLNVVSACVTEGGPSGGSCSQEASGENQTLSQSKSESSGTSQSKDSACVTEGGPVGGSCSQEASGESQTLSQAKSESSTSNQSKDSNNSGSAKQIMSHDESSQPKALAAAPDSQPTNKQSPGELPSPRKESSPVSDEAKENTSAINTEHTPTSSEATAVDEKSEVSKKGLSISSKRDMLRQKAFQFEKNYKGRMSKGAFKAKVAAWGSMVLDKSLRSSSHVAMKEALSKLPFSSATISSVVESNNHPSSSSPTVVPASCVKDHVFASPAVNPKAHASPVPDSNCSSKGRADVFDTSKAIDYYALIPFDEAQHKYLPEDDKDEAILLLVPHMQDLDKELQGWTAWANEKVMQAAQRLGKDKAELKTLRQEREEVEKYKKDKQALEEGTQKRLSEMEYALKNATNQIEMAKRTIHRLEYDNKGAKKEMESAKMQARSTATNLQKAQERERELEKRLQSVESERSLIQEKLTNLKREITPLTVRVEKAKERQDQFKALLKQEEKEKHKAQSQIDAIRKKLDDEEAVLKVEEDKINEMAENDKLKCEDDIKNLQSKIAEMRLETTKSMIAALSIGYGSKAAGQPGSQLSKVAKRLAVFEDNFSDVKPERECVMCLTEEIAVVFVPCAHQVLCGPCNTLHEKQGMNDCPSCRTTIQKRISVTYPED